MTDPKPALSTEIDQAFSAMATDETYQRDAEKVRESMDRLSTSGQGIAQPQVIRIRVLRSNNQAEILTLTGPLKIDPGEKLTRLVTSTGMDHWFVNEDGSYDGWGMACSIPVADEEMPRDGSLPADTKAFISAIEAEREIMPKEESDGRD